MQAIADAVIVQADSQRPAAFVVPAVGGAVAVAAPPVMRWEQAIDGDDSTSVRPEVSGMSDSTGARRRVLPALAMWAAVVGAVALAVMAPVLGAKASPLAPARPALLPDPPAEQEEVPVPEWLTVGDLCPGAGELATHYSDDALTVWAGAAGDGTACLVLAFSEESGGASTGAEPERFNRHGAGLGVGAEGENIEVHLLPANADLEAAELDGYRAVSDHLIMRERGAEPCPDAVMIPTTDGSPAIEPLPFCG